MPIDDDPEFMAIVELWIAGEIEADGMRDRYNALLRQRSRLKRDGSKAVADQLLPDEAVEFKTQMMSDLEAGAHTEMPTIREAR
ncbi:hypothetical protein J2J97_27995 (plasmid) [Rhizobium bangladeshense]|uniref:hypothetical protein n=1 Tax=Rhizobium bangladeshense TaxID=1138189 RepID=UPI001A9858D6|nr:hypothetical protein [Rhizobium bangladeshense]QSY97962.1 hypothetical protein J2J97_27995 [Rhizobium bangladeshense]